MTCIGGGGPWMGGMCLLYLSCGSFTGDNKKQFAEWSGKRGKLAYSFSKIITSWMGPGIWRFGKILGGKDSPTLTMSTWTWKGNPPVKEGWKGQGAASMCLWGVVWNRTQLLEDTTGLLWHFFGPLQLVRTLIPYWGTSVCCKKVSLLPCSAWAKNRFTLDPDTDHAWCVQVIVTILSIICAFIVQWMRSKNDYF